MSTPPKANKDINSESNRLRDSSSIAPAQPNLLHHTLTGRIERSRSASSVFPTRNRRAVDLGPARDRIWQYNRAEQNSEAHLSLPEYITPQSLAVPSPSTVALAESNLPSLESISQLEEISVQVGEVTNLGQFGGSREGSSLMGLMIPTQYQPQEKSFGHFPSTYPTLNYIDQYSRAGTHQAMAQTSSDGYAASYATSSSLDGSPIIPQRREPTAYDAKPNYQYSSAIQSPSYHGDTSSPQQSYPYTAAQGHPYAPAYSTTSGYTTHTQYAQTYGGHYSSSYQQPHTPGAIAPQQHYSPPYDPHSPGYVDATGVRIVDEPPGKPRCFDHGCGGRAFSTSSNLKRHEREKAGKSLKVQCPICGKDFTRPTAMKGHIDGNKCKKVGSSSLPS
ncbi:hypothetical protein EG327_000756 [Venturia inaequalis]|uniref:C2H2-type domain-containing protein n=1 Tax=Venturia inaequalis TaxID=5025 RepID=A0A8H3Z9R9_VENIN|nr:hypothetical protein EG327_000756 [Venturia inaequalis]